VKALSGFEESVFAGIDQEEFRPVSAKGHGGCVPGESDDPTRFFVLDVAKWGSRRSIGDHRVVRRVDFTQVWESYTVKECG